MVTNANLLRTVSAMVVLLVGITPKDAWTQTNQTDTGLRAFIGIRTTPTREGNVRGGTYVGDDMLPGESAHFNVAVGNAKDLCYSSVWTAPLPATSTLQTFAEKEESAAHYVYRFEVRTLEVMTDQIKFDLIWQRTSRTASGEPLQRTQQLTLREGESRAIDLLHGKSGTNCINVVLEVSAEVADPSELRDRAVQWDLWLSEGSQPASMQRTFTSASGESAAFQFDPVTTLSTEANGQVHRVMVYLYGQVRGRVRADGNIDVALNTNRTVSFDLSGTSRPTIPKTLSPAGGSGQKNFILRPGESVKIILPPLGGRVEFRTDPVTGERTGRAVAPAAQSPNEMSITIQARVR